ncbi:hypothetical protein C8J56DRAFT_864301 [Mycena floridula]|nr:hypothetical protein C8J56DRAFT_864301 [Mycena floridula]
MPLYQMVCISVHHGDYHHVKNLVTQTATHILNAGGVVRQLNSLGPRILPQRMKRHKTWRSIGDYWTIHFDTAPRTVSSLNRIMRNDPMVIRWTILKEAARLEDVAAKGRALVLGDTGIGEGGRGVMESV